MHFIISRQELAELLSSLQNIVAQKTPVPILSNFSIEALDSRLIMTATDLTVGLRCVGSAKVITPGSTTLPARRFAQLVRELTSSHLEIVVNDKDIAQVTANASTFRLHGLPKAEFPDLPDLTGATQIIFKQGELKEALYRTAFAVSKEDHRFALTGVFCQLVNNTAIFVGTDAKRLARASISFEGSSELQNECIIPIKAVDEILKMLTNDEEPAKVSILEDKIAVEANECIVITKLLFGDYPDVDQVIPKQSSWVVLLHREELMSLLRQIALFITEDSHSVRFTFTNGELYLNANTIDIGEGRVSMPVNYHGPRFDIAFNPLYFLDILRRSKEEIVSLGFTDPYNPSLIVDGELTVDQKALPNPLCVLMPLRLNEE
ncbi:MAG: DNA polymerase III subunit beta [Verrucomicrobia bacterium]|nr:DNA polymerase III subunit beta [Verrucomicrobiota bacterium]